MFPQEIDQFQAKLGCRIVRELSYVALASNACPQSQNSSVSK